MQNKSRSYLITVFLISSFPHLFARICYTIGTGLDIFGLLLRSSIKSFCSSFFYSILLEFILIEMHTLVLHTCICWKWILYIYMLSVICYFLIFWIPFQTVKFKVEFIVNSTLNSNFIQFGNRILVNSWLWKLKTS